jgi:hypothetical protein
MSDSGQGSTKPSDKPSTPVEEDKGDSVFIRLLTVGFYVGSMSFVGTVLSLYYLFLWNSTAALMIPHPAINKKHH